GGEGGDRVGCLARGGGLHGRPRRRGDADPGDRRSHRRPAGTGDARDPEGVPRHRARPQRALGALARVRVGVARAGRSVTEAVREIPLSRPWIDEREEEIVLEVLRAGGLWVGAGIERFEEALGEAGGAADSPAFWGRAG